MRRGNMSISFEVQLRLPSYCHPGLDPGSVRVHSVVSINTQSTYHSLQILNQVQDDCLKFLDGVNPSLNPLRWRGSSLIFFLSINNESSSPWEACAELASVRKQRRGSHVS